MEGSEILNWHEAHYASTAIQPNIYGLQKLIKSENTYKFLMATIDGTFMSVEYQKVGDKVTPLSKHYEFTNIPPTGEIEVVSISAYERLSPRRGLVVGITGILEQTKGQKRPIFNVYAAAVDHDEEEESGCSAEAIFKLEHVAENCHSTNIQFLPMLLLHAEVELEPGQKEKVFLLSGSDYNMHMYKEVSEKDLGLEELPTEKYFPEFPSGFASMMQVDFLCLDVDLRLTAVGFDNGTVQLSWVNRAKAEVVKQMSYSFCEVNVTSLHFFRQENSIEMPAAVKVLKDESNPEDGCPSEVHLLATCCLKPAVVFRDVLSHGLSSELSLPGSESFDIISCSLATDFDFDGHKEILLGTYGAELLVYKFFPTVEKPVPLSPPGGADVRASASAPIPVGGLSRPLSDPLAEQTPEFSEGEHSEQHKAKSHHNLSSLPGECESVDGGVGEMRVVEEPHYSLVWRQEFSCPLYALDAAQMMGDGIDSVVVMSMFGLHILQPDMKALADLLTQRMQKLFLSDRDACIDAEFHKLQLE